MNKEVNDMFYLISAADSYESASILSLPEWYTDDLVTFKNRLKTEPLLDILEISDGARIKVNVENSNEDKAEVINTGDIIGDNIQFMQPKFLIQRTQLNEEESFLSNDNGVEQLSTEDDINGGSINQSVAGSEFESNDDHENKEISNTYYLITAADSWERTSILSLPNSYTDDLVTFRNRLKTEPLLDILEISKETIGDGIQMMQPKVKIQRIQLNEKMSLHYINPLQCNICNKIYSNRGNLRMHVRSHNKFKKSSFQCDVCHKFYTSNGNLKAHKRIHKGEKPYKCEVCEKQFGTHSHLKDHRKIHLNVKAFTCDICEMKFLNNGKLKRHVLAVHKKEKPFPCKICMKHFTDRTHLMDHMKRHNNERSFKCETCGKSFKTSHDLKQHIKIHTIFIQCKKERSYCCEVCGKCFPSKHNLNLHQITHTNEKPFLCGECGKAFKTKNLLRIHGSAHSTARPFQCEQCKLCFKRRSDLNLHVKRHKGEKPYICTICDRGFGQQANLKRHGLVHMEGEEGRHFSCEKCEKKFKSSPELKQHTAAVHDKLKPYSCDICKKKFAASGQLKRHLQSHTNEKPFSCEICTKPYANKVSMVKHLALCKSEGNTSES